MAEATVTLTLNELIAVVTWASAAGVDFHFGEEPPGWKDRPDITALEKFRSALARREQAN